MRWIIYVLASTTLWQPAGSKPIMVSEDSNSALPLIESIIEAASGDTTLISAGYYTAGIVIALSPTPDGGLSASTTLRF